MLHSAAQLVVLIVRQQRAIGAAAGPSKVSLIFVDIAREREPRRCYPQVPGATVAPAARANASLSASATLDAAQALPLRPPMALRGTTGLLPSMRGSPTLSVTIKGNTVGA